MLRLSFAAGLLALTYGCFSSPAVDAIKAQSETLRGLLKDKLILTSATMITKDYYHPGFVAESKLTATIEMDNIGIENKLTGATSRYERATSYSEALNLAYTEKHSTISVSNMDKSLRVEIEWDPRESMLDSQPAPASETFAGKKLLLTKNEEGSQGLMQNTNYLNGAVKSAGYKAPGHSIAYFVHMPFHAYRIVSSDKSQVREHGETVDLVHKNRSYKLSKNLNYAILSCVETKPSGDVKTLTYSDYKKDPVSSFHFPHKIEEKTVSASGDIISEKTVTFSNIKISDAPVHSASLFSISFPPETDFDNTNQLVRLFRP